LIEELTEVVDHFRKAKIHRPDKKKLKKHQLSTKRQGRSKDFATRLSANFQTFLIAGINWGMALFIANQFYYLANDIFSPKFAESGGSGALGKRILDIIMVVGSGALIITILNEFTSNDIRALSLVPFPNADKIRQAAAHHHPHIMSHHPQSGALQANAM
jgi:hypothetical protein